MDWLLALIAKTSSLYGVVLLLIVMIVGYILLRTGRLQIKTKSVQLGKADIDENSRETFSEVTEAVVLAALGAN